MTVLVLVRHGETDWNVNRLFQGQTDIPLNQRGKQQVLRLPERLAEYDIDVAFTSDLMRAADTATAAVAEMNGLDLHLETRLREAHFGIFEGLSWEEIQQRYPEEIELWMRDRNNAPHGAERRDDFAARVENFMNEVRSERPEQTVLCVAHGGSLGMMACIALGVNTQYRWQFQLNNASVSEITLFEHGALLNLWNDTRHIRDLID
ncbi:MAG: histidine phosphatase family protein [Chloroflexi bacterium]|nr:histidine phosphatase family protein [Chloroflexota bacterium]